MQADTPEEFDGYLRVLVAETPQQVISTAAEFERQWPHSELLAGVYNLQFEAYRSLGDTAHTIQAGEKAVAAAPRSNLPAMVSLASMLANGTDDPRRLDRAEQHATRALELLKNFQVPRSIPPEQWEQARARVTSQAHSVFGIIAFARGQLDRAIMEFESAVREAPTPDAAQYYRLGKLYREAKRFPDAVQAFRRAASLQEPLIQKLAAAELKTLR